MTQATIKQYSRETFDFVTELVKSPLETIQKRHELNWTQIVVYFASVSVIMNMTLMILTGGFFMMLFFPIQMALTQVIYLGITLWISTLILNKNEITIDERELAQLWIKGGILGSILNLGFAIIRIPTFSALGSLTAIVPSILIAGSTYLYLYKTKLVEKDKARTMAIIVGVVVGILPLSSYSGLYWLF